MTQQRAETVSTFAHRFFETQNALDKLIPGIHTSPSGNQMKLIHAFSMKLKPYIAKELLSRETPFKDIIAVIEVAKRHEAVSTNTEALSSWHSSSMYSATPVTEEGIKASYSAENARSKSQKATQICRNFNYFQNCCLTKNVNVVIVRKSSSVASAR